MADPLPAVGAGWNSRDWVLASDPVAGEAQRPDLAALSLETGLSIITLRACFARGLKTQAEILTFLNPRLDQLTSPWKIRDMKPAVERLTLARGSRELVRIYGDYDVDGTTGAALLTWVFEEMGIRSEARQPDRFKDGYGLNVGAVEEAHRDGARVLVTVDCGITSFDAAAKAQELGLDLIVVDHHQLDPKRGLPPALAVVNPQRPDCESGLKQLCGCGLAFYLALALRNRGRELGWFSQPGVTPAPDTRPEPNLKKHLDLVVMATAADMVPLTGDNHILVRQGMEVLKYSTKPGVRALLEAAGVGARELSPGHLGFVIGPRINASGRMQSASIALELLTTHDAARARQLAQEIEKLNEERAATQNAIWDQVRVKVEVGIAEGKFTHGIVVADEGWHEGVVGIVASRVTETFRRPAAVISIRLAENDAKGSVRTYGGKDVLAALHASAGVLKGYGGHRHAAGLSLAIDRLEEFATSFDRALADIAEDLSLRPLSLEGECELADLKLDTVLELERLGPFGPGNPEPVFKVRARVQRHSIMKGRHYKLQLASPDDSATGSVRGSSGPAVMEAVWFGAAERGEEMESSPQGPFAPHTTEWAGVPEVNRFRGKTTPTFRVRDWRAGPTA